jgi:hypothetical protein
MTQGFQFARNDGGVELFNGTATAGETTIAVQTTLVAAASRLTSGFNRAIPIAGSTALLLPKGQPVGSPITVANYAATAVALLVFPPWDDVTVAVAGGKIQNGSANASFSVAQNKVATFYPHANGIDYSAVLSA